VKLFDGLGVGGIMKPCRMATMDIVAVGDTPESMTSISKVGRPYNPNPRLELAVSEGRFSSSRSFETPVAA
jgi:hypothetical protein